MTQLIGSEPSQKGAERDPAVGHACGGIETVLELIPSGKDLKAPLHAPRGGSRRRRRTPQDSAGLEKNE